MKIKFSHRNNPHATHQPVLVEVLKITKGPILEFGCGYGSTPILHSYGNESGRKIFSMDSDEVWVNKFKDKYESEFHQFEMVLDWDTKLDELSKNGERWSIILVDQAPWEARFSTINKLKDQTDYLILHDCNYFPEFSIFGKSEGKISGPGNLGKRIYDDMFKYYKEFFPLEPWPYKETGPPTLLASNFHNCEIEVDYKKFKNQFSWRLIVNVLRHKLGLYY